MNNINKQPSDRPRHVPDDAGCVRRHRQRGTTFRPAPGPAVPVQGSGDDYGFDEEDVRQSDDEEHQH